VTSHLRAEQRVGTTFAGKYRLRRVIGLGGMGAVYAAVHTFTGKDCAVKVLDPTIAEIEGYATRFLREARAASQIGHPAICDVYDAGQDDGEGALYLVLELLEGEDLGAAIKRGDLTLNEILEIGCQTLDGLAAAHARGIVHRDIKPENVFLTRDERGDLRVKLLDFGVAKNVRDGDQQALFNTQRGQVVGTPYYMSPEQASGHDVDRRADVYSTGAMIFHALAGRPPFKASNYNTLILKILGDEPPPSLRELRPDLPEWLVRLVDGALLRNPVDRWQSAQQMAIGLRNRSDAPIGLEWESHEDATVRTQSPFHEESLAPASLADAITPSRLSAPSPVSPPVAADLAPTVAATPSAQASAGPTPHAWDRPAQPRRSSAFFIGLGVGAAVALLLGVALGGYLVWRAAEAPSREPAGRPLVLDAGAPDASDDAGDAQ
jgi:serine/threonine-protein kinase